MESRVLARGQASIYMEFHVNLHGLHGTAGAERGQGPILHGIPCKFPVNGCLSGVRASVTGNAMLTGARACHVLVNLEFLPISLLTGA